MGALLKPWMSRIEAEAWEPTELVLAPHFLLNLLPLHAALWRGQPLIEHFPVVYLPSPALAEELAKRRKPLAGEALLLGNPLTGQQEVDTRFNLSGAEAEVGWVADYLRRAGMACHLFVREQATSDRVRAHATSASLVHFACHAVLEAEDFLRSGVELADRRLTVLAVTTEVALERAALVFLSSCSSGQAVPGRTDELLALVRVFLSVGSPTVVATLWALDDEAGSVFASHFYNAWVRQGLPLAVAFQQAMRQTRTTYSQPFYWAPFVLMGAW